MARTLFRFGSCLNERKVNAPFSLRSCYRFHIKLHNIRGLFASMPESYSIKAEVILVMTQLSTPTRTPTLFGCNKNIHRYGDRGKSQWVTDSPKSLV